MYLTIFLIIFTAIMSYKGLRDDHFQHSFSFSIRAIRFKKDYIRFVSSGFLHINWMHLIINMIVLFSFGTTIEANLGMVGFLFVYLGSMVGGNGLAYLIHKDDIAYSSVGASGAVSGLVFGTIALFPHTNFFFIPAWVFGLLYIGLTLYAIRSQKTNVGHAAHLGGALIGMLFAILFKPNYVVLEWWPILAIMLPALALIFIILYRPNLILISKRLQEKQFTIEDRYNSTTKSKQEEIDRILEKINNKGINSLSRKEKEILEEHSRS